MSPASKPLSSSAPRSTTLACLSKWRRRAAGRRGRANARDPKLPSPSFIRVSGAVQDNPILVEVTRGGLVESCHRGAVAIADADGRVLLGVGDIERPVYPRSAVKAMQALPLIESGAADAFRLGDKELAIACASHSGEEAHIDAVRSLLAKAGLDESQLACGAHWPIGERASRELMRAGKSPTAIHNNCSGKHAGMLAVAVHRGLDPVGYERLGHPVQQEIRRILS